MTPADISNFIEALGRFGQGGKADETTLLTMKEACAAAKVSRWTMHRWIKKGLIRALKIGKSKSGGIRIYAESLHRFLGTLEIVQKGEVNQ